ncbi:acyltransferase family protein [Dactylosporangium roseum]|uniref:Acyltransferase family protein n=1 Tax=Dactylosporangium roseum TaxID=47989 RepID=A0ABY5YV12_9ACTN|nr:acyltransferase [Dactylosporangium roseum]UWZ33564.1 acyltransferase family protein [Dactylosporangium roseum]
MDRNNRLPSLTGLRWAAALTVFGQHLLERLIDPHLDAAPPVRSVVWAMLANAGGLGVSFFFVLSGFVLAWSTRPGEHTIRFWWHRWTKIYPATLVTTLAAVVLVGGAGPLQLATHLTFTQSWVPRHDVYGALNPVGWSMACEAFFYLCFPALFAALRRLRTPGLWAVTVMMIEIVIAVSVNLVPFDHATALYVGYLLPPVRMAEFTLGVAAALLVRSGAWRGPGLRLSLALVPPAAAAALFVPFPVNQQALTLVPVTLVVAAAARADLEGRRTLWSRSLMVYLGKLSFAFYLVHYLVFVAFERYGLMPRSADPFEALLATLAVFSLSVIAAMVVYHGVELPGLRLLRRTGTGTHGRHRAGRAVFSPTHALPPGPSARPSPPVPRYAVPDRIPAPRHAPPEPIPAPWHAPPGSIPAARHAPPPPRSTGRHAQPEPAPAGRHARPEAASTGRHAQPEPA